MIILSTSKKLNIGENIQSDIEEYRILINGTIEQNYINILNVNTQKCRLSNVKQKLIELQRINTLASDINMLVK